MSQIKTLSTHDAFTLKTIHTTAETSLVELIGMINKAQKAQSEWKASSIEDRIRILDHIISEYMKAIALTDLEFKTEAEYDKVLYIENESAEQGLPLNFTRKANFEVGLSKLKNIKKELESYEKNYNLFNSTSKINQTTHSPVGLVSVILSWNLSNRLFIETVIPSLMAGNAVLVKPSSVSHNVAYMWNDLLKKSGLDENLVQFVFTSDVSVKSLLITHPAIKAVAAYGTLPTCQKILKAAESVSSQSFKKLQLKSGAKNSAIYWGDFDQEKARDVLESFLIGRGGLAWNSSKLYISEKQESVWHEFLIEESKKWLTANSIMDESCIGPVVNKSALKDRLPFSQSEWSNLVELVKKDQGSFFQDYWVKNLSRCSELQQNSLSAPLYILDTVKYPFDIPKYSNVGYYGFAASVWADADKLVKVINQLEVGLVSLNRWAVYVEEPIYAVKQSAFGIQDCRVFGEFHSNVKKAI